MNSAQNAGDKVKLFHYVGEQEKRLLRTEPILKYRNYCFDRYVNNLDNTELSKDEINGFLSCYDNLKALHNSYQLDKH